MRPEGGIIIEETCGGDKRNHLEYGAAEGMLQVIIAQRNQFYHDEGGECHDKQGIELEF